MEETPTPLLTKIISILTGYGIRKNLDSFAVCAKLHVVRIRWPKVLALALLAIPVCSANAQVSVRGYFRADGTYVQPHVRSAPNSTRADNWSTKGNVNPYTGKVGTENPAPQPNLTPPLYAPVIPPPKAQSPQPFTPIVPAPSTTEKERAMAEIMTLLAPQEGRSQPTERKICYTIYDCQ
jgi:hypothetical protein